MGEKMWAIVVCAGGLALSGVALGQDGPLGRAVPPVRGVVPPEPGAPPVQRIPADVPRVMPVAPPPAIAPQPVVPTPITVPTTTTPVEIGAYQKELLRRMESANAEEREAAKKELAAIASFLNQPEMLRRMAEVATEAATKLAFESRARELEFEVLAKRAGELPPISLNVNRASLTQLSEALNKALGVPTAFSLLQGATGSYTLDVKDKPFWEVLSTLQSQQPFDMLSANNSMSLMSSTNGIHRAAINGPVMVFPRTLVFTRNNNPQAGDAINKTLQLQMVMVVDPRLEVARYGNLGISKAVDEQGRSYLRNPIAAGSATIAAAARMRTMGTALEAPEPIGKRLSVTCEVNIAVEIAQQLVIVNDVAANVGKQVLVGDRNVLVSQFAVQPTSISMSLSSMIRPPTGDGTSRVVYTLLDAGGQQMWTGSSTGSLSSSVSTSGFTGPYRLEVRGAGRLKEIPLKFELTDIPLP